MAITAKRAAEIRDSMRADSDSSVATYAEHVEIQAYWMSLPRKTNTDYFTAVCKMARGEHL